MPLLPAQSASHISSTASPNEVITPSPVTTTRRICIRRQSLVVGCWSSVSQQATAPYTSYDLQPTTNNLLIGVFLDVVNRLADGLNLLGLFVGDREFELVLELHDQLDGVEGVGVEVVDEVGFARDLALIDAHLFAYDFDDLLFSFVHNGSCC